MKYVIRMGFLGKSGNTVQLVEPFVDDEKINASGELPMS